MLAEGLISDVADLFTLRVGDLSSLEGMGELSGSSLVAAISGAKARRSVACWWAWVSATWVRSPPASSRSLSHYRALADAPLEVLEGIDGVGPVIAASVYEYCREPENQERMARLSSLGLTLVEPAGASSNRLWRVVRWW